MLLKRTAPFSLLLDEPDLPLVDGRGVGEGEGDDAPLLANESSRRRFEALSSSVSSLLIALTGIGSGPAMGRGASSSGSSLTGRTRFRLAGSLFSLFEGMVG